MSIEYRCSIPLCGFRIALNSSESVESFLYMFLHANLRGEDVPHNTLLVYDVRHPAGEETQGTRRPVERPHLATLVAEQGEGQIVLRTEASVRPHGVGAYPN